MKLYERTENGTTTRIPLAEGLAVINYAQMDGKRFVRTMSASRGDAQIEYKNGIKVTLRQIEIDDPEEPAEWHGTHSNFSHLHRFTEDNRARCNRRIRANATPPVGGKGEWGVFKRTRSEVEASEYAHLYTFCPRCEAK